MFNNFLSGKSFSDKAVDYYFRDRPDEAALFTELEASQTTAGEGQSHATESLTETFFKTRTAYIRAVRDTDAGRSMDEPQLDLYVRVASMVPTFYGGEVVEIKDDFEQGPPDPVEKETISEMNERMIRALAELDRAS